MPLEHFLSFSARFCKFECNTTTSYWLNSIPDDKILDWSKLKAFADDKINVT